MSLSRLIRSPLCRRLYAVQCPLTRRTLLRHLTAQYLAVKKRHKKRSAIPRYDERMISEYTGHTFIEPVAPMPRTSVPALPDLPDYDPPCPTVDERTQRLTDNAIAVITRYSALPCPILTVYAARGDDKGRCTTVSVQVSSCVDIYPDDITGHWFSSEHMLRYTYKSLAGQGRAKARGFDRTAPQRRNGNKRRSAGDGGQSHLQTTAHGRTIVDTIAIDDIVQDAATKWLASRQHKRVPLDTVGSVRFAVQDHYRHKPYDAEVLTAEHHSVTPTSEPIGYLILKGSGPYTTEQLNTAVRILMRGGTQRQVSEGLTKKHAQGKKGYPCPVNAVDVNRKLLPVLRAIYSDK